MSRHFPWLFNHTSDYITLELSINDEVVGGLIVLEKKINKIKIGLVGLVCIDSHWRGHGLLKHIFGKLEDICSKEKFSALILWTSQHRLYEPYGFHISDNCIMAKIKARKSCLDKLYLSSKYSINERQDLALPPFANKISQYKDDEVSIIYCEKGKDRYIVDYSGALYNVIKNFSTNVNREFILNSINSKAKDILSTNNFADIEITQQKIQMIKILNEKDEAFLGDIKFKINERI